MITLSTGNIFDSDCEALVNPVNCSGVCGAGLAKEFKERFPNNYRVYYDFCKKHEMKPGGILPVALPPDNKHLFIVNFATKGLWTEPSSLSFIERGLANLKKDIQAFGIRTIAIPALGCGLGGLQWRDVRELFREAFEDVPDIDAVVFEPYVAVKE